MTLRFTTVVVALLALVMGAMAHAAPTKKYFKGTIARRSATDPKIKQSKTLEVEFKNKKMKAKKLDLAKGKKNKAVPHANTIREIKVVKIKASDLKKGGK